MGLINANTILSIFGSNALISSSSLGDVTADVKISEAHQIEAVATTTTLENGTQVTDHIISKPIKVTLNFEMTNASRGLFGIGRAQDVFDTMSAIVASRELVTLTTEHAIYNNMVILSFTPLHRAPYRGALQIAATLQQINFSTIDRIALQSSGTTAGDLNTSLSSTVDSGRASAQYVPEVNSSVLSDFKNSFFG